MAGIGGLLQDVADRCLLCIVRGTSADNEGNGVQDKLSADIPTAVSLVSLKIFWPVAMWLYNV